MKTMIEEREDLIQRLTNGMDFQYKDLVQKTIGVAFDFGAKCAHMRAKMLLESLEDFQKSIYNIIGGEKE